MSLDGALAIAASGLYAIQGQISVVSQNVANANSPGYVEETASNQELVSGSQADGVRIGPAIRVAVPALQTSLYAQNAQVAGATVLNGALSAVTSVFGSTDSDSGSTGSLTSALSTLQSAFTSLQSDPQSQTEQQSAVGAASGLVSDVQTIAGNISTQRQAAADGAVSDVGTINQALGQIGALSNEIVRERTLGMSTAGLEDQRDAAMTTLSQNVSVRFVAGGTGSMSVYLPDGTQLPTDAQDGPLSLAAQTVNASDTYPGKIGGVMLGGTDITASLTGGSLGANIQLRDTLLPTAAAELDSFAATVANRLSAQGLDLFTDPQGNVPSTNPSQGSPAGIVGFAAQMSVNPTIAADATTLGTAGGENPALLFGNVATYAFGDQSAAGTAQTPAPVSGLGPGGNLSAQYSGTGSLSDLAADLIGSQGAAASSVASNLADATSLQTSVSAAISSVTSVSIDSEMAKMVSLQNSYSANAKIVGAVQSMFSALLDAVAT